MMRGFGKKLGVLAASVSLIVFAGCNSPSQGQNQWSIEGVDGPHVTYSTNQMVIYATLKSVQIDAGVTVAIPHMPNSTIELTPDLQTNGMLLQTTISAADVATLMHLNVLNPLQLPGGRPLPGVAGGELPGLAVQVPKLHNITFYVGPKVFGLFVPVNFSLNQVIGTFAFYDNGGNHLGNISVVGEDANKENSGFLLLANINWAASVMVNQGQLDLNALY